MNSGNISNIQFNHKLVWFTGGLDSTFSLQQMLNKTNQSIGVGYIFHGGVNQKFYVDEIVSRRATLNRLNDVGTLGKLSDQEIYVMTDRTLVSSSVIRQAVTVANATVQTLLTLSFTRPKYLPDIVIGWHKDDARENSLAIGDYTLKQYKDLQEYIKVGLNTFNDKSYFDVDVILSAWDMDKGEMYRKLGGCAITFGAMKWSLKTEPSGETYVTLSNPNPRNSKVKEMKRHYGIELQPIKLNVKELTVGDLLFLLKSNPDFIMALIRHLFPKLHDYEVLLALRESLEGNTIARYDDFFITDNTPWVNVINLDDIKDKAGKKQKVYSTLTINEQSAHGNVELTPLDSSDVSTAETLTKTRLVSAIACPMTPEPDEKKEGESKTQSSEEVYLNYITPGNYFNRYVLGHMFSVEEFSNISDINVEILNDLIDGKIKVDESLAKQLATCTPRDSDFWLDLQKRCDRSPISIDPSMKRLIGCSRTHVMSDRMYLSSEIKAEESADKVEDKE